VEFSRKTAGQGSLEACKSRLVYPSKALHCNDVVMVGMATNSVSKAPEVKFSTNGSCIVFSPMDSV
jgi:hypothetical protein